MEEHKYLILVVCHDVYVRWNSKQKSQNKEYFQIQFCTTTIGYEKRSRARSVNLLDVALKFEWAYSSENLSKEFEVSFGSSSK